MAAFLANNISVLTATLYLPIRGVWHCDLMLDTDEGLTGSVTLTDGTVSYVGTVFRSGASRGSTSARIFGGSGGFGPEAADLPAKSYGAVPFRTVIGEILTDAGEALSSDSTDSRLANYVPHWSRLEGPVAQQLGLVVDHLGLTYRVNPDGTVFIGVDTYPTVSVVHEVIDANFIRGTLNIAPESFDLLPVVTLDNRKIDRVTHQLGEGARRTEAFLA